MLTGPCESSLGCRCGKVGCGANLRCRLLDTETLPFLLLSVSVCVDDAFFGEKPYFVAQDDIRARPQATADCRALTTCENCVSSSSPAARYCVWCLADDANVRVCRDKNAMGDCRFGVSKFAWEESECAEQSKADSNDAKTSPSMAAATPALESTEGTENGKQDASNLPQGNVGGATPAPGNSIIFVSPEASQGLSTAVIAVIAIVSVLCGGGLCVALVCAVLLARRKTRKSSSARRDSRHAPGGKGSEITMYRDDDFRQMKTDAYEQGNVDNVQPYRDDLLRTNNSNTSASYGGMSDVGAEGNYKGMKLVE